MLEVLAFVVFVGVLSVIQWRYVSQGEPTISERIRSFVKFYPPAGRLALLVIGLFLGHWFWND